MDDFITYAFYKIYAAKTKKMSCSLLFIIIPLDLISVLYE